MTIEDAIRHAESVLPGTPAPDDEIDERWQAIISIGTFVETNPKEVWSFVRRWGAHNDEDLRTAIATCLLEHLLEFHFQTIFPLVEEAARVDALFADTFLRSWKMGEAKLTENAARFDRLAAFCRARG